MSAYKLIRLLLGIIFVVFGLNGLVTYFGMDPFIAPPQPPLAMMAYLKGLQVATFLMFTVKLIEVVAGLMLLSGTMVRLALVMLAPIVYNIFMAHLFVDQSPMGIGIGITVAALWGALVFFDLKGFKSLFSS